MSNVKNKESESCTPCLSVTTDAIPEAKSTQTGVSVRYVPAPNKKWYVFRATYGRADKASDYIIDDGTYVYIAKRYTCKSVNGKQKKVLKSLIPNLLFVYTTEGQAKEYVKNTPALSYLTFYYNHFEVTDDQKNPPLIVSRKEMDNFIIATCSNNEHLRFVEESQCHFKGGEIVRITDGDFKGVEGRVARVAGQQRVIVEISGLGLIATAYIPTAFLMRL